MAERASFDAKAFFASTRNGRYDAYCGSMWSSKPR
jgi:hypothetical protein